MVNKAREYTQNTAKRLYGLSGNVCANPNCRKRLIDDSGNQIGEIAHIAAASPDGPRYDSSMTDDERRAFDNLILLCEDCNKLVDNNPKEYPAKLLREWKAKHENFVSSDTYNIFWKNINQKICNFEIRKKNTIPKNECYNSTIEVISNDKNISQYTSVNVFSDYLQSLIKTKTWTDFPDIFLEGIGGIGKSTEFKIAYNDLLDTFMNLDNYDDYQFCPIPYYFELKDFHTNFFQKANDQDNIILFLDGLDEISNTRVVEFQKNLNSLRSQFWNIRFIISGRNAAFINLTEKDFINTQRIKLTHYFTDEENKFLIEKYRGTKILDIINIPFYRTLLETEDVKGYKDFFDKLLLKSIKKDKERIDYANNITKRESSPTLEEIQNEMAAFCHLLFDQNRLVFSVKDLQDNTKIFNYVINASFILYESEEKLSFTSNILFEYFLALYFTRTQISDIKKELFFRTGRINVKYINVIGMLLVLLDKTSRQYQYLTKKLRSESNAFIVLTDFAILSEQERWNYYLSIFEEFNSKKELIFYLNHNRKHGIFSNIESLCESMYNLLPESKKDETVKFLCNRIIDFINIPKEAEILSFANTIILLGIWNIKLWNTTQQEELKNISIPLINFLMTSPIVKRKLGGLLSERLIFNWYKVYDWTLDWEFNDWYYFIKQINPNLQDLYVISNENDYKIKMYIFLQFHKDSIISKLALPLAIHILCNLSEDYGTASFVPEEIDDDFQMPVSHLNEEVFEFNVIFKESINLTSDDLVTIAYETFKTIKGHYDKDYESKELFNILTTKWNKNINNPSEESNIKIFKIIQQIVTNNLGSYAHDLSSNLNYLSDNSKESVLNKILEDSELVSSNGDFFLYIIISNLLNISDKQKALYLFKKVETTVNLTLFKDIIRFVRSDNISHCLKNNAELLLEKYFSKEITIEQEKRLKINSLMNSAADMQKNEAKRIQSKALLLEEIERIDDYLSKQQEKNSEIKRHNIYELSVDNIKNNINFDYKNDYIVPPVFSDFVIKFIEYYYKEDDYKKNIKTVRESIDDWFSNEMFYWRFFFWHYIREYSEEKVTELLKDEPNLKTRIINSLEHEIQIKYKTLTLKNADIGNMQLIHWLTPFIYYVKILFENHIPEFFPKDKLSILTTYCSWHLKLTPGFLDTKFPWLEYNSVFDWLFDVANLDKKELIRLSFEYYKELTKPESKSQLLYYYINHIIELSSYKNAIIHIIIAETCHEIKEDYSDKDCNVLNYSVLSNFWNTTEENYIDEIINDIPFETYRNQSKNSCLTSVIEYFIRKASFEQKKTIINKYRKKTKNNNVRQLLSALGDIKANLKVLKSYLHGAKSPTTFSISRDIILNQNKKSNRLLFIYLRLLKYSLKKVSDRRSSLYMIALSGIRKNITSRNFLFVSYFIKRIINTRRKSLDYFEGLLDFLDELEQIAYSNK